MKVFISWSGGLSKAVAELVKPWLKCVLQATEPWISTEDVDKGSIWFNEVSDQLDASSVGIICLTSENISKPWILFEAGALAKGLTTKKVCTLLINLKPADLEPPLANFNATTINKEEVYKLVGTVNKCLGDKALDDGTLKATFDQLWPKFETEYCTTVKAYRPSKDHQRRSIEQLVEEILQISRQNQSTLESLRGAQQREFFAKFAASLGPPQGESLSKSLTSLIMANDIGDPSAKQALGHYLASLWASRQPPPEPGKPSSESPTGEKL